jgi:phosphatidylglycerol---prolipoprotein diacylglyceryl transferase
MPPAMMPVIFRIPGLGWDVPGYGLALMIGFFLSILWAIRRTARSGGSTDVIVNCGFISLVAGLVGARFMYVAHYWSQFANRGSALQVFWSVLDMRKGGLEVYGGFLAAIVAVVFYLWLSQNSIRWYMDIIAPSAALGHAVTRIGCFLNGCCWGGVCEQVPWAVRFPYGSPAQVQQCKAHGPEALLPAELLLFGEGASGGSAAPIPREALQASDLMLDAARSAAHDIANRNQELRVRIAQTTDPQEQKRLQAEIQNVGRELGKKYPREVAKAAQQMDRYSLSAVQLRTLAHEHPSLPVHPTQIYATITLLLLALLLNALYWRRTRDGQVICMLLLVEPWTRWVLEILRADNPIDTLGQFTISQFLAICISAIGLVGLLALRRLPPRSPRAAAWQPAAEAGASPTPSHASETDASRRKGKRRPNRFRK